MNLKAGIIEVRIVEIDGVPVARASVIVQGTKEVRFETPLEPGLRDIRDDVSSVASRAADTMLALVRDIPPYANPGVDEQQRADVRAVPNMLLSEFFNSIQPSQQQALMNVLDVEQLMMLQMLARLAAPSVPLPLPLGQIPTVAGIVYDSDTTLTGNGPPPAQVAPAQQAPSLSWLPAHAFVGPPDQTCELCGHDPHDTIHRRYLLAEDRWVSL